MYWLDHFECTKWGNIEDKHIAFCSMGFYCLLILPMLLGAELIKISQMKITLSCMQSIHACVNTANTKIEKNTRTFMLGAYTSVFGLVVGNYIRQSQSLSLCAVINHRGQHQWHRRWG